MIIATLTIIDDRGAEAEAIIEIESDDLHELEREILKRVPGTVAAIRDLQGKQP